MKIKKWFIGYASIIVIFSTIYWLFWENKPDNFIINTQLNVYPFTEFSAFLWDNGEYNYKTAEMLRWDDLKREYDSVYVTYKQTHTIIDSIKLNIDSIEISQEELAKEREVELTENIANYEKEKLAPFDDKISKLKLELDTLEGQIPIIVSTENDIALIEKAGKKRVEIANTKVKRAEKAYSIAQYISSNLMEFMSPKTRTEFYRLRESSLQYYKAAYEYEEILRKIRSNAIIQYQEQIDKVRERLGFWDFLYYSIGISTTTTFGDIVANSRKIRCLVSLQLLLCIFVVAGFTNAVIKSLER